MEIMLRRPPTRIPLKTEDIEEYEEMLREKREMEIQQLGRSARSSEELDDSIVSQRAANAKRKKNAAERIGLPGKR